MESEKKVILLIVNHLKNQLSSGKFNEESLESMEVAVQCIESAYSLNPTDSDNVDAKLENIVKEYYQGSGSKENAQEFIPKAETAEYHKNRGNEFMKMNNNEKAIEEYTKSITLNPDNPIYYCNRAAAYNAIGKYYEAIEDSQTAISLDSTYSKAYCRLGLAFSHLKDYNKAVTCYKKACNLDPNNVGYQRNYQLALNSLQAEHQQQQNQTSQTPNESVLRQENLMETAARFMSDPEVSSVLNNFLGDGTSTTQGGLDRLMQVGQTFVSRLQTANPNLLDGLRMQFQNAQNEGQPSPQNGFPDQGNNPNPNPN